MCKAAGVKGRGPVRDGQLSSGLLDRRGDGAGHLEPTWPLCEDNPPDRGFLWLLRVNWRCGAM